jgi:hypothetical protein
MSEDVFAEIEAVEKEIAALDERRPTLGVDELRDRVAATEAQVYRLEKLARVPVGSGRLRLAVKGTLVNFTLLLIAVIEFWYVVRAGGT